MPKGTGKSSAQPYGTSHIGHRQTPCHRDTSMTAEMRLNSSSLGDVKGILQQMTENGVWLTSHVPSEFIEALRP